jgi:hypothetical protein
VRSGGGGGGGSSGNGGGGSSSGCNREGVPAHGIGDATQQQKRLCRLLHSLAQLAAGALTDTASSVLSLPG